MYRKSLIIIVSLQVYIAVISACITVPINLLLVGLFRSICPSTTYDESKATRSVISAQNDDYGKTALSPTQEILLESKYGTSGFKANLHFISCLTKKNNPCSNFVHVILILQRKFYGTFNAMNPSMLWALHCNISKMSWGLHCSESKNVMKSSLQTLKNVMGSSLQCLQNVMGSSLQYLQNFMGSSLQYLYNVMGSSLQHLQNFMGSSLQYLQNVMGLSLQYLQMLWALHCNISKML